MIEPLQEFPVFEEFPALGRALNIMIRRINAITPRGAGGHKVKITSAGTVHESAAAVEGTAAPAAGMVFRGEWRDTVDDYVFGDLVVIRGGVSAGAYIALDDVPVNSPPALPDGGVYWASISRDYPGVWS